MEKFFWTRGVFPPDGLESSQVLSPTCPRPRGSFHPDPPPTPPPTPTSDLESAAAKLAARRKLKWRLLQNFSLETNGCWSQGCAQVFCIFFFFVSFLFSTFPLGTSGWWSGHGEMSSLIGGRFKLHGKTFLFVCFFFLTPPPSSRDDAAPVPLPAVTLRHLVTDLI